MLGSASRRSKIVIRTAAIPKGFSDYPFSAFSIWSRSSAARYLRRQQRFEENDRMVQQRPKMHFIDSAFWVVIRQGTELLGFRKPLHVRLGDGTRQDQVFSKRTPKPSMRSRGYARRGKRGLCRMKVGVVEPRRAVGEVPFGEQQFSGPERLTCLSRVYAHTVVPSRRASAMTDLLARW